MSWTRSRSYPLSPSAVSCSAMLAGRLPDNTRAPARVAASSRFWMSSSGIAPPWDSPAGLPRTYRLGASPALRRRHLGEPRHHMPAQVFDEPDRIGGRRHHVDLVYTYFGVRRHLPDECRAAVGVGRQF